MTSKYLRFVLGVAVLVSASVLAQTGGTTAPSSTGTMPAAPSPVTPSATAPAATTGAVTLTGSKVGTINIEQAVLGTNEGRRDFEALNKKLEPKQNELKSQNDELEALQKQLNTQQDKLNEDARGTLVKQIETKKKSFDRSVQDAQEDAQNQQKEIFGKILAKMAPMIVKYASDNGYGLILDTSQSWPQSPVVIAGEGVDITKPVVDIYNTQSGVAGPSGASTGSKPATKPSTTTPKPTTPKPSDQPK